MFIVYAFNEPIQYDKYYSSLQFTPIQKYKEFLFQNPLIKKKLIFIEDPSKRRFVIQNC
jgi:hypothetical protein